MSKPWLIIGRVAYLYTDSFLIISGLLAAYTLSRLSPVKSVISRYIRLVIYTSIIPIDQHYKCTFLSLKSKFTNILFYY